MEDIGDTLYLVHDISTTLTLDCHVFSDSGNRTQRPEGDGEQRDTSEYEADFIFMAVRHIFSGETICLQAGQGLKITCRIVLCGFQNNRNSGRR
jgi:hypothetical protein